MMRSSWRTIVSGRARLRVDGLAVVLVAVETGLARLVIRRGVTADSSSLGVVAVTHLIGSGVLGQVIGVLRLDGTGATEAAEEALARGTRSVVVLGAGSEASLLAAVTDQDNFHDDGEDEKEAGVQVSNSQ